MTYDKPYCCKIDCQSGAHYVLTLYDGTIDDIIDSCKDHVAELAASFDGPVYVDPIGQRDDHLPVRGERVGKQVREGSGECTPVQERYTAMTNTRYRVLRPWCDGEGMYPHVVRDACTLPEAEKSASLSPAFYIERLSDGAITSPCGEWLAEPVLGEAP